MSSLSLVTGAGGFIGRHVVEELLRRGEPVRGMVRQATRHSDDWRARGAEVVVGDIRDPAAVAAAVQGVGVVHHCAAAVGQHYTDREVFESNLEGVRNVLNSLKRSGAGRLV